MEKGLQEDWEKERPADGLDNKRLRYENGGRGRTEQWDAAAEIVLGRRSERLAGIYRRPPMFHRRGGTKDLGGIQVVMGMTLNARGASMDSGQTVDEIKQTENSV